MKTRPIIFGILISIFFGFNTAASTVTPTVATAPSAEGAQTQIHVEQIPNKGIQPQIIKSPNGTIHLSYFSGDLKNGHLFYTYRKSSQKKWSNPTQITPSSHGFINLGPIAHHHMAVSANGTIHISWLSGAKAQFLYSQGNGKSFSFPKKIIQKNISGVESSAAITCSGSDNVHLSWHAGNLSKEDERRIYFISSSDSGKTFGAERAIDTNKSGACGCCGIKMFGSLGTDVYIGYRSAAKKRHRDFTVLTSGDSGKTFKSKNLHQWEIEACPVSTAAFAKNPSNQKTNVTWETKGQIYWKELESLFLKKVALTNREFY